MSPIAPPRPEDQPKVEERLRKMTRRWPEITGYHLNPEPAVVEGIVRALVRHTMAHGYPYCPCRDLTGDPAQDRVNICPCQFHHEEIRTDGHCRCVLFVGDNYDSAKAYDPRGGAVRLDLLRSVRARRVTVYTTSWCFQSRRTKALLTSHGVTFEDVDIERNPEAARQVEAWNRGMRSVPTIAATLVVTEPSMQELESILGTPGVTPMRVTAHVTTWCGHSRRALAWLRERGIAYQAIDIEGDFAAAEKVRAWNKGYLSVPTIEIVLRATEPSSGNLERMLGLMAGSQ
ncbi:MAG: glutaredoxin domain-containing protein [Chloroflexota bacterium]